MKSCFAGAVTPYAAIDRSGPGSLAEGNMAYLMPGANQSPMSLLSTIADIRFFGSKLQP